ncbi:MAG: hypothetical protein Ct9H300mP16_05550 [Pseudomonadota bacterium]|nr:MAG: hypothetical protein Ct9H300mP16_05550 [Pseudomonadota bacterium]
MYFNRAEAGPDPWHPRRLNHQIRHWSRSQDSITLDFPVSNVEASLAFYAGILGLETERVDQWRRGEVNFPSVRLDGKYPD